MSARSQKRRRQRRHYERVMRALAAESPRDEIYHEAVHRWSKLMLSQLLQPTSWYLSAPPKK